MDKIVNDPDEAKIALTSLKTLSKSFTSMMRKE